MGGINTMLTREDKQMLDGVFYAVEEANKPNDNMRFLGGSMQKSSNSSIVRLSSNSFDNIDFNKMFERESTLEDVLKHYADKAYKTVPQVYMDSDISKQRYSAYVLGKTPMPKSAALALIFGFEMDNKTAHEFMENIGLCFGPDRESRLVEYIVDLPQYLNKRKSSCIQRNISNTYMFNNIKTFVVDAVNYYNDKLSKYDVPLKHVFTELK